MQIFTLYNSSCELKEQNLDSVLSNKKTLISLYDRGRNDNGSCHVAAAHASVKACRET
jgi:hypothetical protein